MATLSPIAFLERRAALNSELRRQGDRFRDERNLGEAIACYRRHVDDHPGDFGIWVQLGNCFKDLGTFGGRDPAMFGGALAAYMRAIGLNGRDADVFLQLGHLYKVMGRPLEAGLAYRCSVVRQPEANVAAIELSALRGNQEVERAVASGNMVRTLRRRPAKRPASSSPDRTTADRCRDEGRWLEAARAYQRHVKEHPYDFAIWVQAGNCIKDAGGPEEALEAYWQAIALDAEDSDVFMQLGHLHKTMGRLGDATECYRLSVALKPHDNPAVGELEALTGSADTIPQIHQNEAQPVQQRLDHIADSLQKLIETKTSGPADSAPAAAADRVDGPTLTAVREAQFTLNVVVDASGSFDRQLVRVLCELGISLRLVRWAPVTKQFELISRRDIDRLELADVLGPRAEQYPVEGGPIVVVRPLSCGKRDWVLVPFAVTGDQGAGDLMAMDLIVAARRLGVRSAFVFKDAAALRLRKHAGVIAAAYEQYMQALLLADLVLPTSVLATNDLSAFLTQHQNAGTGPRIHRIRAPESADNADAWREYGQSLRAVLLEGSGLPAGFHVYYLIDRTGTKDLVRQHTRWNLAARLIEQDVTLVPATFHGGKLLPVGEAEIESWLGGLPPVAWAKWMEPGETAGPGWVLDPTCVSVDLLAGLPGYAKGLGLRTAAILHHDTGSGGAPELLELLGQFDRVFAASDGRQREFYRYLLASRSRHFEAEHRFTTLQWPNEVPGRPRALRPPGPKGGPTRVLICLGTEGPSGVSLANSVRDVAKKSTLAFDVTLLPDSKGSAPPAGPPAATPDGQVHIGWAPPADLGSNWMDACDFAVVDTSRTDGLLLLAEAAWRGVPFVAIQRGSGDANAHAEGGLVVEAQDRAGLSLAISHLADPARRRALSWEAIAQPVRTWADYSADLLDRLASDRLTDRLQVLDVRIQQDVYSTLVNLRRRPKLSLCISTYNRAGWVGVNLRNIFAQVPTPRDDLEVLVVDNTSTDNTREVVQPYLGRPDFRFVRNVRNVGMLGNLAVTAQNARGEYIWILGDDDLTRPGAIEKALGILHDHPGIGLVYVNYGYTTEANPANVVDLAAFLEGYNKLEPPGPDEYAPVKRLAAKCENFFGAIYSHIYRRDHGLKAYCQDTSGRIFSTMRACIPTTYYVLNYMAEEPACWIGDPCLVVNSNVSWQDYGPLLELEHLPHSWDLAERMGTDPKEVDQRRANRLWLIEMMWRQIFSDDRVGNSAYFSAPRALIRLKHLPELDKHIPEFSAIYERARQAGHPAARMPTADLFAAFAVAAPGIVSAAA